MTAKDKLNSRQRLFCINLASGMSQTQAYINAGYPVTLDKSAGDCASRLLSENARVLAYYNQLLETRELKALEKVTETVLSVHEKRGLLADFARAQTIDFLDENGHPKLTKDTPHGRAAREFYSRTRTDRFGNPIITKSIKLLNPIEAIQEDNKMAGHYAPSKHLVANYNVSVSLKPKNRHNDEDTT